MIWNLEDLTVTLRCAAVAFDVRAHPPLFAYAAGTTLTVRRIVGSEVLGGEEQTFTLSSVPVTLVLAGDSSCVVQTAESTFLIDYESVQEPPDDQELEVPKTDFARLFVPAKRAKLNSADLPPADLGRALLAPPTTTAFSNVVSPTALTHALPPPAALWRQVLRAYVRVEQPAERREDQPHRPAPLQSSPGSASQTVTAAEWDAIVKRVVAGD